LDNSINYKTPSFGGVVARLAYALGEQTTGPSKDLLGLAVNYANGPLFLGAGYQQSKRVAAGDDKEYAVGAGYSFGAFDVKANYLVADPDGANNKFEQFNLGASMLLGTGRLSANLQQNKIETGAKGKGFAVAYAYPLSKRTSLYTSYAVLNNNAGGQFGLESSGTKLGAVALDRDPSVFAVGVQHLF
ncbi:MAG: porin, partial [Rhodoferax sp.]